MEDIVSEAQFEIDNRLSVLNNQIALLRHVLDRTSEQLMKILETDSDSTVLCNLAVRVDNSYLSRYIRGNFTLQGYSTGDLACLSNFIEQAQLNQISSTVSRISIYGRDGLISYPAYSSAGENVLDFFSQTYRPLLDLAKRLGTLPSIAPVEVTAILPPQPSPADEGGVLSLVAIRSPSDPWYLTIKVDGPDKNWMALTGAQEGPGWIFEGAFFTAYGQPVNAVQDPLRFPLDTLKLESALPPMKHWSFRHGSLVKSFPLNNSTWRYEATIPLVSIASIALTSHPLLYFGVLFSMLIVFFFHTLWLQPSADQFSRQLFRLVQARRSLSAVFSISPDAWALLNNQGQLLYASQKMVPLLSINRNKSVQWRLPAFQNNVPHYLPPLDGTVEDRHTIVNALEKVYAIHQYIRHNITIIRISDITQEARLSLSYNKTRSELYEAEQNLGALRASLLESEKMAALGDLVAGLAHEVNTPIGIAIGAAYEAQTIAKELKLSFVESAINVSPSVNKLSKLEFYAQTAVRNLERASSLITHFKDIGAHTAIEDIRTTNLEAFLTEHVPSLRIAAEGHGHQLLLESPGPVYCQFDVGLGWSILSNVVNNAIAHAFDAPGGVIIVQLLASDDSAILSIQDNGKGIPDHLAGRIWEPFFTTKRGTGGTGLGLSIVYRAVHHLGGTIKVLSTPGSGTEFAITFPLISRT
ncbi:sensor histidine kinase [Nitrospirillum amazonense]|uniref:sensor histidine kinase n=1 Tax=Nitrospirillum amazonense TaxID=28077 RepID=UPI00241227D0|nr:HAMP domain-containing sensor histidine kinase [Nitrospirillum amazonense]MDG3444565.1 HAMP domain-containing sensor histidine kinase [Nitrospirillum amazonense]